MYIWKDAPAYKNERLEAYQQMLAKRGITKSSDVKLLTAQLIQEAGSLDEKTIGDHGCSFGIIQFNACSHAGVTAATYLKRHPEWKDWRYQLEQMADMVSARYTLYHGNIKQIIVHHNRPSDAKANRDTKAGYFKSITARTSLLQSL